ncbi:MAG: PAS domain S-box protein [Candidatus Limiplasma sp.]|nr:PAS domain S-box protein [Candidatus Limiplasma sp.]
MPESAIEAFPDSDQLVMQRFIGEMPFAYAYHQMLFDSQGNPEDYVFLAVNKAFEEITTLKSADIIGRRVTEIIPGIRSDPANWIGVYGEVVQTQKANIITQYDNYLKKWFNVYAMSPIKDHFITLFMDFTKTVKEQKEQIELFRSLNDVILELDGNLTILRILMAPETPIPLPREQLPDNLDELIGMNALQFLEREGSGDFQKAVEQARLSGQKVMMYQHMLLNEQDTWYQLIVRSFCIDGQDRVIISILNVTEQKELEIKLLQNEALFQAVFHQAPIGISVTSKEGNLYSAVSAGTNVNQAYVDILGRSKEELAQLHWTDITHPDDLAADSAQLSRLLSGQIDHYQMEKRYFKPDGSTIWVNFMASAFQNPVNQSNVYLCLLEDITKRKALEQSLRESERSKTVLLSHLPGLAYRCLNDPQWTMKFVSDGCFALTGYQPASLVDNRDLSYNDLIAPAYRAKVYQKWQQVVAVRGNFRMEYEIITAGGEIKWVLEMGQPVFDDLGQLEALEGVVFDITEQKQREQQLLFMSVHDETTRLYNLMYFDQTCRRHNLERTYPLTVVQCDVDGLRLINNAFGMDEGNALLIRIANLLARNCKESYTLARTGDDDFSILMPHTNAEAAEDFIRKATDDINAENDRAKLPYHVSLSFGYGSRQSPEEEVGIMLKTAFSGLHNQKILHVQSSHSATLSSIMTALHARSEETEEHAQRLLELTAMVGRELNLSQKSMAELALFAKLHDIGKIGISDAILNKPGALTEAEWAVMRQHSEIGYRIAISLQDIAHVANDILSHHERWDGSGYPRGLQGEAIPLPARILAVADAYDAMSQDRVYRKAMAQDTALREIRNQAGKQFDPSVVEVFLKIVACDAAAQAKPDEQQG